jgi:chorismate mutase
MQNQERNEMELIGKEDHLRMRMYVLESLMARVGKNLEPALIQEITKEIMERLLELDKNTEV